MGAAHDYRIRMIIKRPSAVSTEIFPVTLKRVGGRKTRLWLATTTASGLAFGWIVGK
jgi:hypothetical protein